MGFFGNLWSGIKNVGSNVWSGLKRATNWGVGLGNKIRDGISTGYNYLKKIPVIGSLVDKLADTQVGGVSLRKVGEAASKGLDTANTVNDVINTVDGYINPKQAQSAVVPGGGASTSDPIARLPAPKGFRNSSDDFGTFKPPTKPAKYVPTAAERAAAQLRNKIRSNMTSKERAAYRYLAPQATYNPNLGMD